MPGVVAIIGRPNVGKSSLFNRLIGERRSITDDAAGITRDRIYGSTSWLNRQFSIIDTGGIILKGEPFSSEIKVQAELAIDEADVLVMVTDVRSGVTSEDWDVARLILGKGKPVVIAANKADDATLAADAYDFYSLGADQVIPVSALHGIGTGDLLDFLVSALPPSGRSKPEAAAITFALIGQTNVGKSTLANALVAEKRMITSAVPHTTRDAVDLVFTYAGERYCVIDTAGMRKAGKLYENAEFYSSLRALRAVERASVAVIVLDGAGELSEQDKRVAGLAREYNRAAVIVVNKWDKLDKDSKTMTQIEARLRNQLLFLDYAPIVFVSALTGKRLDKLLEAIKTAYTNFHRRVETGLINDVLQDAFFRNPAPEFRGNRLKLSYATQAETAPPTFVLFVNKPQHLHFSYLRYLENQVRANFDFSGTPLKFILRKKE